MKKGEVVESSISANTEKIGNYFLSEKPNIKFFSSGCQLLDCVLGGGYVVGRMVNLVGDKSTGKTLLAIEACANFHRTYPKGKVKYLEAEAAFDKGYAAALGMPLEVVEFVDFNKDEEKPDNTVEALYENLLKTINDQENCKTKEPLLYIIDSMDALSDRDELERDIDKGTYGAKKPKVVSEIFRRLVDRLEKAEITLFIISQVRDNIGVTFGSKDTRSGGRALDFYASQILWLAELGKIKKMVRGIERPIGISIRAKCKKNKVGLPYRECDFPVLLGFGIDDIEANLNWLEKAKALEDLGYSKNDIKKVAEQVKSGDVELRNKISSYTKEVWREVETGFLPTNKKY